MLCVCMPGGRSAWCCGRSSRWGARPTPCVAVCMPGGRSAWCCLRCTRQVVNVAVLPCVCQVVVRRGAVGGGHVMIAVCMYARRSFDVVLSEVYTPRGECCRVAVCMPGGRSAWCCGGWSRDDCCVYVCQVVVRRGAVRGVDVTIAVCVYARWSFGVVL